MVDRTPHTFMVLVDLALHRQRYELSGVLLCDRRTELSTGDQTVLRITRGWIDCSRSTNSVHRRINPQFDDSVFSIFVSALRTRDAAPANGQYWLVAIRHRRDHSTYPANWNAATLSSPCQRAGNLLPEFSNRRRRRPAHADRRCILKEDVNIRSAPRLMAVVFAAGLEKYYGNHTPLEIESPTLPPGGLDLSELW